MSAAAAVSPSSAFTQAPSATVVFRTDSTWQLDIVCSKLGFYIGENKNPIKKHKVADM